MTTRRRAAPKKKAAAQPRAKAKRTKRKAKAKAKVVSSAKTRGSAKRTRATGTRKAKSATRRPARRAQPEPELTAEDTAQVAKQFAYVLTPVEPAAAFALGSIIASRPPLPPPPPSARVQAPFAERAGGAGSCAQCDDTIARAAWQVVVTDDGATIHPGCAFAWMQEHLEDHDETESWMSTLVERLSETDRAELLAALDRD